MILSSHLGRPAARAPTGTGSLQASASALDDQLALELGERREDAEDELSAGRRRVDAHAVPGQHAEADAACGQVVHGVDEVAQVTPEAIELPDDERVPFPESFRATGITLHQQNEGKLEEAQDLAGHADARTTRLYVRKNRAPAQGEVERVQL
jgi:integrase